MAVKDKESIMKISRINPNLAKLLERNAKLSEEAAIKFAKQKGIPEEDAINRKGDWNIILELARFISDYTAMENNKKLPQDIKYMRVNANGIPAEWVLNPNVSEDGILFFLFGGGYIMGNLETRRTLPAIIGRAAKIRCLNIQYRLAPEYPFPAAIEDSIHAYKWLLSTGINSKKIIICGASAGGGLSVATLLKIRELSLPMPAGAILLSPWVDLSCKGKSIKKNAIYEPELATTVRALASVYLNGANKKNPFASPIYADLSGLPPLLIQVGEIEVLHDECMTLAEKAKMAGIDVTLEVWEGMTHVFQNFGDELPESKRAIENIKKFIYNVLKIDE
ncbi:MAG: alpha/beta hydrolase [Promethearchaeota archaeon]